MFMKKHDVKAREKIPILRAKLAQPLCELFVSLHA